MNKRRAANPSRGASAKGVWFLFFLGVCVVGGLAAYIQTTPNAREMPQSERRATRGDTPRTATTEAAGQDRPKGRVEVLKPEYVDGDLRYTKSSAQTPRGQDERVFAVNEFLRATGLMPGGARAVSCVVEGGVATIEFSPEFDQTYGTEDERTIVDGVLRALAQFEGVRSVQFQVGGKPMETLGNIDLSRPLKISQNP